MRPFPVFAVLLALAAAVTSVPARAEGLRVIATDARGLTLELATGAWSLSAPNTDGRVAVVGGPAAHSLADPGHALLPAWSAMLSVPLDARPTVRVLSVGPQQARDGVRVDIARRPSFLRKPSGEFEPGADPVAPLTDGLWPVQTAVLGTPGSFRGRRLVGLEVRPFQYDEAQGRLVATAGMVVRVDFNRPAGASALPVISAAPDPHVDEVLGSSVINFEQARAWRAAPAADPSAASLFSGPRAARPTSAQAAFAFDESQPEVRVKVDTTGMYLLPYDLVAPKGYPAGTPISRVSVHRHEFVEGAAVPYVTIELPIEVDDLNGNGLFDSGDRLWVYVQNWAERSGAGAHQRLWGDAEVVYVTVNPAGGLRIPQRGGWRGQAGLTPLPSFPYTQHWERNIVNMMPFVTLPSDTSMDLYHWTELTTWVDKPEFPFDINRIDTTRTVRFRVGFTGRAANDHYMFGAVKNRAGAITSVADNVYWFGKREQVTDATLTGSAFSEGTNSFLDWGKTSAGPYDPVTNNKANVALNWFETTYWRRFEAVHDQLYFNSAGATGEIQVHAGNFFSDSIRVWDVTQPEHPVRIVPDAAHFSGGTFDFQDSLATGETHAYVAMALQEPIDPDYGPRTPPASNVTAVTRRPTYVNGAGDYLLIVPEAFLPAVGPLVALRQGQGLNVVVATTEQLYDEYNGGRHSAAAIQRFIRYAYAHWSSRFALFVGDGTLDPQNNYGRAGTDWVPVLAVPGPVPVGDFEVTVSDNAYSCITGNCDPTFGSDPVIPELMVGRLPVNSLTDAQNVVAKIVAYEDLSGDQSWRLHSMLISDDAYSDSGFGVGGGTPSYCWKDYEEFFVGLNHKVNKVILQDAGLTQMNVEMFNLRSYITNPAYYNVGGLYDTCRVTRSIVETYVNRSVTPVLFAHMNSGAMWVNFQGHANEYVLTHEDLYLNSGDFSGSDNRFLFANGGKPILWTAFSCHPNMFARPEGGPSQFTLGGCLGEDMVTMSGTSSTNGGAIASWGSSGYEIVPYDSVAHLNVALATALFADPPVDPQLAGSSRVVLGEAIQAAFVRYMPTVSTRIYERGTPITYTLLGDPAQRISIGQPQLVVWANDTLVTSGQAVRLHSPGDTLRIVADLVSTVRIDSIGLFIDEGTGEAPVALAPEDIVPAFPDTAGGGVYGGRRFEVTYRTHLKPETYHYRLSAHSLDGLVRNFVVQFNYDATLRVNGTPIRDGDAVSPGAALSIMLVSPAPITDPATQLVLTINGANQSFVPTNAPGDASGREWVLTWTHPDYAPDNYTAVIALTGGPTLARRFRVTSADLKIAELLAFPNPFDNDGTRFSFMILGADAADVRISVMTISGRRVWSDDFRGLAPGYHQIPWDGRDAEGAALANGTYFYRVSAVTPAGRHTDQIGRMVKLRKPRHVDIPTTP